MIIHNPPDNIPDADYTLMTIIHTGTRWINSCFDEAGIKVNTFHIGQGREIKGTPITLLRDPIDIIKSFIYRERTSDVLWSQVMTQREWIEKGTLYFSVEKGLIPINNTLGINLIDNKKYHSDEYDRDSIIIPDDFKEVYDRIMEIPYWRIYRVVYNEH